MKSRIQAVLAFAVVLGTCLSSNHSADAQVYEGPVTIVQSTESSGRQIGKIVGYIYVPSHPDERAPYLEQAVFLPEYRDPLAHPGVVTMMVPYKGSLEDAFSAMAAATQMDGAVLRVISARRVELEDETAASEDESMWGLLDWLWRSLGAEPETGRARSVAMGSPSAAAFDVIQFPRSNPRARKLVGRICADTEDRFLPQAGTWTVMDHFEYLRPSSELLTEIVLTSDPEATCAANGETSIPSAKGHRIRIDRLDEEDGEFDRMWAPLRERRPSAKQRHRGAASERPASEVPLDAATGRRLPER